VTNEPKTRLRITLTVVLEYDANPKNYPVDQRTPEGMLAVDLESAEDDPYILIGDDAAWKITGEIVK